MGEEVSRSDDVRRCAGVESQCGYVAYVVSKPRATAGYRPEVFIATARGCAHVYDWNGAVGGECRLRAERSFIMHWLHRCQAETCAQPSLTEEDAKSDAVELEGESKLDSAVPDARVDSAEAEVDFSLDSVEVSASPILVGDDRSGCEYSPECRDGEC